MSMTIKIELTRVLDFEEADYILHGLCKIWNSTQLIFIVQNHKDNGLNCFSVSATENFVGDRDSLFFWVGYLKGLYSNEKKLSTH